VIRVALHVVAGTRGGPRTYGVALARALFERDDVDLVVLTDRPSVFGGIPTVELRGPRPLVDELVVPRVLKRIAADVYHNTKNVLPRARLRCPSVVTLHDLAYHHQPETFGTLARVYLRYHHRHCARAADRIIAVSHHARQDLVRTLGVPDGRVRVVYHGVAPQFHEPPGPPPRRLRPGYVLSVGTIQPRKNLDVLVDAFARLERDDLTLAIAGRRGWKTRRFDEACRRTPVRLLGPVSDRQLPGLYAHAGVFVQPSSYEGFGLTAAEAMACGAPVIAAHAGSLPEVVGDAALLVPPRDVEALAAALERVLAHEGLAGELAAAGRERARTFTWERSAAEHVAVYRELAGRRVVVPA